MIKSKDYIANEIVRAVSEKLGREAIYRKVNNRAEYFILDLAFSYFQKADRNRRNDYRSGYLYERIRGKDHLHFVLAHTPIMSAFFKNNFDYEIFRKIIKNTAKYRNENFLVLKKRNCKKAEIRTRNTKEFLLKLDGIEKVDLVKSVLSPPGKGRTGIGNIFGITLANDFSAKDIKKIITKSWALFLWLYPSKPIFQRNASLNRSLQKIDKTCEIGKITNLPDSILNTSCSGQIEGAHIKPHKNGGSDKLANGVWL
ncbi:MAG: hypothetical protein OEW04_01520 [Nitrospirota bacterium]|nr:hypothetical protein [Nitrospirota bacterium]